MSAEITTENNFGEFHTSLRRVYHKGDARRIAHLYIRDATKTMWDLLQGNIPDGEAAPPNAQRPSIRLWGKSMRYSFEGPQVQKLQGGDVGASGDIVFDHPSVEERGSVLSWYIGGTKPHLIPSAQVVITFWWGRPLKWTPPPGFHHGLYGGFLHRWGKGTFNRGYWAKAHPDFISQAFKDHDDVEAKAVSRSSTDVLYAKLDTNKFLKGEQA